MCRVLNGSDSTKTGQHTLATVFMTVRCALVFVVAYLCVLGDVIRRHRTERNAGVCARVYVMRVLLGETFISGVHSDLFSDGVGMRWKASRKG